MSIFIVFLIKAKYVGRGGGERGAGSKGRRETECCQLTERGNLRQTDIFRAQRDRRAWKYRSHRLGLTGKEALIDTAALSQGITKRQAESC